MNLKLKLLLTCGVYILCHCTDITSAYGYDTLLNSHHCLLDGDITFLCKSTLQPGRKVLCIHENWVCDSDPDCPEGEDEGTGPGEPCHGHLGCTDKEQFQCADDPSLCIPTNWMCDGDLDCDDGSDETKGNCLSMGVNRSGPHVQNIIPCPPNNFQCGGSYKCIPLSKVCDNVFDCDSGVDEAGCANNRCDELNCTNCVETSDRARCYCDDGLQWDDNTSKCVDIDECQYEQFCDQVSQCKNTEGNFECNCVSGHKLAKKTQCKAINDPEDQAPSVLLANEWDIQEITIDTNNAGNNRRVLGTGQKITVVDFDFSSKKVFWISYNGNQGNSSLMSLTWGTSTASKVPLKLYMTGVEGFAIDWVTKNWYLTDASLLRVYVCSSSGEYCQILAQGNNNKSDNTLPVSPRSLVLDPAQGVMYYADWNRTVTRIMKQGLDGSDPMVFLSTKLAKPSGLSIDYARKHLYWADMELNVVERIDLTGDISSRRIIAIGSKVEYIQSTAIFENYLYLSDRYENRLTKIHRYDYGEPPVTILGNLSRPAQLRIYHRQSQPEVSNNPCDAADCEQICTLHMEADGSLKAKCLCGAGYQLSGSTCTEIDSCKDELPAEVSLPPECSLEMCKEGESYCEVDGMCLPTGWWCDGKMDCPRGSDEGDYCIYGDCAVTQFTCNTGRCIDLNFVCDGVMDCGETDNSDEMNCENTTSSSCYDNLVPCDEDPSHCLPLVLVCDGYNDCSNGSDEDPAKCGGPHIHPCVEGVEYTCRNGECIAHSWMCDGDADCLDGTDEGDVCNSTKKCKDLEKPCSSDDRCIPEKWFCDGEPDCLDRSDESDVNCPDANYTCLSPNMKCTDNGFRVCVKPTQLCDGVQHCENGTDEGKMCSQKLCETDNKCSHICHNSPEGYICDCPTGEKLTSDKHTCVAAVPVDKLCDQWGICGQDCELLETAPLGYRCKCFNGFFLEPDDFTCKPLESAPAYVIFSNRHELRRVDIVSSNAVSLKSGLRNTIALDFYYKNGIAILFWTDVMEDKIYRGSMIGDGLINVEAIITSGLATAEGVVVDWVGENIYWVESTLDQIEVAKLDGSNRTTLIAGNMTSPRAIVVDPSEGVLFWTDWDGKDPRIEGCSMSGEGRSIIHHISAVDEGGWPNGLTVDYDFKRLYWIDARSKSIHTIDYYGNDHRLILKGHKDMSHPFAMALFGNHVYWTDWSTNSVVRANKFSGADVQIVQKTITQPFGLQVVHPKRQANMENPCAINNGGCSDLCLINFNKTVGCRCPHRKRLDNTNKTCVEDVKFLLFVRKHEIRGVDMNQAHYNVIPVITIPYVETPTAVDYDPVTEKIYWADKALNVISRAGFNAETESLIDRGLSNVEGLAIDWRSGNMYFSSYTDNTASISAATLNGTFRTEIIVRNITKPKSIALHPFKGFMFFADVGGLPGQHKIFQAAMDGSACVQLLTGLDSPTSLSVDVDTHMLYFINAGNNSILRCDINGDNCRQIQNPSITKPEALAVYKDFLFVSADEKIVKIKKTDGSAYQVLRDATQNINALMPYDVTYRQKGTKGQCEGNQCSQLCLPMKEFLFKCKCTDGYVLEPDNHTCKGVRSFLLYAKETEIRGQMFQTGSILEALAPISQIQSASAVDFHEGHDTIYWVDKKSNFIARIKRDLTNREVIVRDGINSVEGLAIDWIAGNIYWTDAGHSTIEMATIEGDHRYVIISGDMEKPRSIVVHPERGYLYWSDWGMDARIERARLDGSERVQYVYNNLGKPWGLTIDYETDTLYWCDSELKTIELMDLKSDTRKKLVESSQQFTPQPISLTVYQGHIYWLDSAKGGSVYRTPKNENQNSSDIVAIRSDLGTKLKDIKAFDPSRQTGTNRCQGDKGGCPELCFYVGNGKTKCACSFGKLSPENKCEPYEGFIMFSKVTGLESINLNDSDNKNPPWKPIKNDVYLRNVIGLTYDFTKERIFYSDIQRGDIQMVKFNGGNVTVIIDGIGSAEGLAYERVNGDLFWTSYTNSCISQINVESALNNVSSKPTVVVQMSKLDNPRAIVVDSCWKLIYWTNWHNEKPKIQRSNLQGFNVEDIISKDILTPNGLTIDHRAKKLYWSDARLDRIERCDMDGSNRVVIITSIPQHSFGLAIYGDYLFWTDWMLRAVIRANKYDGTGIVWLRKNLERQPMGIITVAEDSDKCELHPCHNNSYGCQDRCFTDERGQAFCQCTHGRLKADGKTCASPSNCTNVGYEAFPCLNGYCLPFQKSCDGIIDCVDGSDEMVQTCKNRVCPPTMYGCQNKTQGQCIALSKKCNGITDCRDGSDEMPEFCACAPQQFRCKNGICVSKEFRCNGVSDCFDNSDEVGCDAHKCSEGYVSCNTSGDCIPLKLLCDGQADCAQGSDEDPARCPEAHTCSPNLFRCKTSGACIYKKWQCDKDMDCDDNSDETDCVYTCSTDQFSCINNSHCISKTWVCDGNPDCEDHSDEANCKNVSCTADQFACSSGQCISNQWTCDGEPDCQDGADESKAAGCAPTVCEKNEFQCANHRCVEQIYYCDGDDDCGDSSDEPSDCNEPKTCTSIEFSCNDGYCIDINLKCNGKRDCMDNSDEVGCNQASPCGDSSMYLCANGICIPDNKTCNGENDCGDASDEPANCNVNECKTNPCSQICDEKKIGYQCRCNAGFQLRADNRTCEDVDECQTEFPCSHFCINTIGAFYCDCAEHYKLEEDKRHCNLTAEEGRPYLLVSNRYYIRRVGFNGSQDILVSNLTHSVAIDFDYQEQMLYWTDIHSQSSTINRISMNKSESLRQVLHSSTVLNPDGIAVDWIGRNLYWCDRNTDTVEVSRLDGLYRKILVKDKTFLREPRALELFPKYGYLFLSDWGDKPHISRISMDGKTKTHIITEEIAWPNALTIDYVTEKLFWADANFDYIAMADLDGKNRRTIISNNLPHTFALTTFMDHIFWTDWETNGVFMAEKFSGEKQERLTTMVYRPMDLVVYHTMRQPPLKTNPCDGLNCSHLCLLHPTNDKNKVGASCACPENHKLNEDKKTCSDDCNSSQFLCQRSSKCIPKWWVCDNNTDCEDGSDEPDNCRPYHCNQPGMYQCKNATDASHCIPPIGICDGLSQCSDNSDESEWNHCANYTCMSHQYKCEINNKCISDIKVCDGIKDCPDNADEENCQRQECLDRQFPCNSTGNCIPYIWQCDGDYDCYDQSDEANCENRTCKKEYLKCEVTQKCIPKAWECDGEHDCGAGDDSDEKQEICAQVTCDPTYFKCDNAHCIPGRWRCDEDQDCSDGSDERNCDPRNCTEAEMPCADGKRCIPLIAKCDGHYDCKDNSDEQGCPPEPKCQDGEFTCVQGSTCIPGSWKCDGDEDCVDGSDEDNCQAPCGNGEFRCKNGSSSCMSILWRCDGENDCNDGSDEEECGSRACPVGRFRCGDNTCIPIHKRCNGQPDCKDSSDEDKQICNAMCPLNQYQCKNQTKCLRMDQVCDGTVNCASGDDEDTDVCSKDNQRPCLLNGGCDSRANCTYLSKLNKRRCFCKPGFRLGDDGTSCIEDNPCDQWGRCPQKCQFKGNETKCTCGQGYFHLPQLQTCLAEGPVASTLVIAEEDRVYEQKVNVVVESSNVARVISVNASKIGAIAVDISSNTTDDWKMFLAYPERQEIKIRKIKVTPLKENGKTDKINRNTRDVSNSEEVFLSGLNQPEGLAVDWVGKTVYWTDSGTRKIEMKQYGTANGKRRTMVKEGVNKPFSIVVDPNFGKIFWVERGYPPRIESAKLDGTDRQTLVQEGVIWPSGMAIDYPNQRLYWADTKSHTVETVTLEGKGRHIVKTFSADDPPYLVEVFEDMLYVTTYRTHSVLRFNKFYNQTQHNVTKLLGPSMHVGAIIVYQSSKQQQGDVSVTNACKNHPCPGKTQMCINSPADIDKRYSCVCPDGAVYDRKDKKCNFKMCSADYCKNNGTCTIAPGGEFKCSCPIGFSGKQCENDLCKKYCHGDGECHVHSDIGKASCKCGPMYSGERCEHYKCMGYCQHGLCVAKDNKPYCLCKDGYSGERCDTSKSSCDNYCYNNGTCSQTLSGRHCNCLEGFTGSRCEQCMQHPILCANNGVCIKDSANTEPHCQCAGGEDPNTNCQHRTCKSYCMNNAQCSLSRGIIHCKCVGPYTGERCDVELHSCNSTICLNGGTCDTKNSINGPQPFCRCRPGFSGYNCDKNNCLDVCKNDGNCTANNGDPVCTCPEYYKGIRCDDCVCQPHGQCVKDKKNKTYCRCDQGLYEGKFCNRSVCHDYCFHDGECVGCHINPQTNIGQCKECKCKEHTSGTRCQTLEQRTQTQPANKTKLIPIIIVTVIIVCLVIGVLLFIVIKRKRNNQFRHSRLKDQSSLVANPIYTPNTEDDEEDDTQQPLDQPYDPEKPVNFANPVYEQFYQNDSRQYLLPKSEEGEDDLQSKPNSR